MLRNNSAASALPRPPRTRTQSDNVLEAARTVTQLTKDATGFACVPIASQAASLMQSLLEVAKVSTNWTMHNTPSMLNFDRRE